MCSTCRRQIWCALRYRRHPVNTYDQDSLSCSLCVYNCTNSHDRATSESSSIPPLPASTLSIVEHRKSDFLSNVNSVPQPKCTDIIQRCGSIPRITFKHKDVYKLGYRPHRIKDAFTKA